jgi:hypothetical protein
LCRGLIVGTGFCNDHAECISGVAGSSFGVHRSAFFGARGAHNAARKTIFACVKWNGFDNFTGNSLSHLITPTIIIVADSHIEIKKNLAVRGGGRVRRFAAVENICNGAIL